MMHVGIQASHMSERQHVRMRILHTAHKLENPRSKHKPGMEFQQGDHLKTSTFSLPSCLQWKH